MLGGPFDVPDLSLLVKEGIPLGIPLLESVSLGLADSIELGFELVFLRLDLSFTFSVSFLAFFSQGLDFVLDSLLVSFQRVDGLFEELVDLLLVFSFFALGNFHLLVALIMLGDDLETFLQLVHFLLEVLFLTEGQIAIGKLVFPITRESYGGKDKFIYSRV